MVTYRRFNISSLNYFRVRKMFSEDMDPREMVLLTMHNLCSVRPESSKTGKDIAQTTMLGIDDILRILRRYESEGYVKRLFDENGNEKFYLTCNGIIKVCASFT